MWAGLACTFVRLQGCPLRCHYCDTSYSFREGSSFSIAEVVQRVQDLDLPLVQITGGEPLVQDAVSDLIYRLSELEFTVLVETSGVCDIQYCDPRSHLIVDIKTPNSGAPDSFLESNYAQLSENDELKFVIVNREDFDWAVQIVEAHELVGKVRAVHFSPVMEQKPTDEIHGCESLDPSILAKWIIEYAPWAHLQLQIHKFIWSPDKRGV